MESSNVNKMEFKITDYIDFIEILHYLFNQDPSNKGIRFTMSRPKGTDSKSIEMPIIVYSLVNKQPGLVGEGVREIKPRYRQWQRGLQPSNCIDDDVSVQYRNQLIDAEIDFTIYASDNENAYELASQLRKFIQEQMGMFLQMGISRLIWLSEEDNSERIDKDYYVSRKLTYLLSYEEVTRTEYTNQTSMPIDKSIIDKINVFMNTISQEDIITHKKQTPEPPKPKVSHSIRFILQDLINKLEAGVYTLRETTEEDESYPNSKYIIIDDKGLSIDIDTFLSHDIEMSLWKEE